MSKILITGSEGVIGKCLSQILKDRGHTVSGVDLFHTDKERYSRADVSQYREIGIIIKIFKPDFVFHAAAEFGRWNGEEFHEKLWMTNAVGTKNIIKLQRENPFKLIHFSSSEVYGDFKGIMSEDVMEQVEIKQLNDYAMTKWVNEMQIRNSATQDGTESVVVRLFNTYGPGETYHPFRSVNARFCHHALKGLPITVYRGHRRTSTYLEDTCRTLANIVDNFIPGETYNIGGSEYHSIEKLAEIIWKETGADPGLITYADAEPMTTKNKQVDISKAIRDLDHKLTVSLEEGVKRTIEWMKSTM